MHVFQQNTDKQKASETKFSQISKNNKQEFQEGKGENLDVIRSNPSAEKQIAA